MIKTRLLGVAQFLLLALYLLGGFGVLVLAVVRSGDWGALAAPGPDRLGDAHRAGRLTGARPVGRTPVAGPQECGQVSRYSWMAVPDGAGHRNWS
ncbi:hypothetical protein [Actinoplanes philippinensis]|uniref:hypothetical protein n=1 Tax=Actinoplanes philippinensis TaxID=35752 RepID=UPI0033CFEC01